MAQRNTKQRGRAARGGRRAVRGARRGQGAQRPQPDATEVVARLRELYPEAACGLRHSSAYELLVATMLSAQCTDQRVNLVAPQVFARYPDPAALADADAAELEGVIRSTGFYRNKARNLIGMARTVRDRFGGAIPKTMDELLTLPGVARKTANVVLGTWFGRNDGVVVDTHIGRIAVRLGLAPRARDGKDAVRIERELMERVPREAWTFLGHALIQHGRRVCRARKPRCGECGLSDVCPSRVVEREPAL